MHYLAIVIVVFALALVIALAGCHGQTANGRPFAPPIATVATAPLTRADMAKRLQALAASPTPKKLAQGAMCYKTAARPDRLEYVCPTCGQKTLYASEWFGPGPGGLSYEVPQCRRWAGELKAFGIRLDESEFCKSCNPQVKQPRMVLAIVYSGEPEPLRIPGVTASDLRLLVIFFAGQDRYSDDPRGGERALKHTLPRLRELLGVQADPATKQKPKDER